MGVIEPSHDLNHSQCPVSPAVYQLLRGLPSRPSLSNGVLPHRRGYATSPSSPKRELLPGKR